MTTKATYRPMGSAQCEVYDDGFEAGLDWCRLNDAPAEEMLADLARAAFPGMSWRPQAWSIEAYNAGAMIAWQDE
jgi:hypothetical protein